MILLGGEPMVRPRYFLPLWPMMLLAILQGLYGLVGPIPQRKVRRRLAQPGGDEGGGRPCGHLLCSQPAKIVRQGFYYSYLSYSPQRYYEKLRGGQHAELFPVGEVIRANTGADDAVLAITNKVSLLHYASHRRIVPFPALYCESRQEALDVLRFLEEHKEIRVVVMNLNADVKDGKVVLEEASRPFVETMLGALDSMPDMKLLYAGQRYRVYERQ